MERVVRSARKLWQRLVGTPEQVADQLLSYWKLGIDEFILSGFPHVEECHRTAEQVLPLLKKLISNSANS